jgi:diguanylate cyclase (GGDEF)-like protein
VGVEISQSAQATQGMLQGSAFLETGMLAVLGILVAVFVGVLIGRLGKRDIETERDRLGRLLNRAEAQVKEQGRITGRLREQIDTVDHLFLSLPDVVRDINRSDIEPREVPDAVLKLAQAFFQPAQILLYEAVGSADGPQELVLARQIGLENVPAALARVRFGEGKLGWVALNDVDMVREDWSNTTRTEARSIADNHPALQADIVGPLVHRGEKGEEVLGVLAVGGPARRHPSEKRMFQVLTNLATLAFINSRNTAQLRENANRDGLTQLFNKRYFKEQRVPKLLHDCEQAAHPLSFFIFDIDHFKTYNDTNGHPAGDDLLRNMAKLIRTTIRPIDVACRYGGEEFLVAMPETDRDEAYELAEKLRQRIESTPFPHREKQPSGRVSISGGVAAYPKDGMQIEELIQMADEALYKSKKGGRNRVTLYRGVQIGDPEDTAAPFAAAPAEAGMLGER